MNAKMHHLRAALLPALLLLSDCSNRPSEAASGSVQPDAELRFVGDGARANPLTKKALAAAISAQTISTLDPYYQRSKRFSALPLAAVLAIGFPQLDAAKSEFVLRALDGYAVPIEGSRLLDAAAYLAIADLDAPASGGWEPIGPRQASPAPYYLIWSGADKLDLERFPRPWALASIEHARLEALYPHTVPPAEDASAGRGYEIFRRDCIHCHAINREGGRVGPELNVPRSIIEYRPLAQLREFIRAPQSFRYGAMPPHPHLSDDDLDGIIAYFQVMSTRKYDPKAGLP